jgi:hypothetical protein
MTSTLLLSKILMTLADKTTINLLLLKMPQKLSQYYLQSISNLSNVPSTPHKTHQSPHQFIIISSPALSPPDSCHSQQQQFWSPLWHRHDDVHP